MKLKTKFQDEDFELGEVVTADIATMPDGRIKLQAVAKKGGLHTIFYNKLEKLYEEWEDYEEDKWLISCGDGRYIEPEYAGFTDEILERVDELGLLFDTKKEAEKAVEKLKALKRLRDKGFKFTGWEDLNTLDPENSLLVNRDVVDGECVIGFRMTDYSDCIKDLDLLFGGEE